jgi:hypothetical protein
MKGNHHGTDNKPPKVRHQDVVLSYLGFCDEGKEESCERADVNHLSSLKSESSRFVACPLSPFLHPSFLPPKSFDVPLPRNSTFCDDCEVQFSLTMIDSFFL